MAKPIHQFGCSIRSALERCAALVMVIVAALPTALLAQSTDSRATQQPAFDIVSIRPAADQGVIGSQNRPDGGFSMTRSVIRTLVQRGYPAAPYIVGLPDWATTERYDITAVPPPGASAEDRLAMTRTLLADRFKLLAHIEEREQPVYELVMARPDGQLGPSIRPSSLDCEALVAQQRAEFEALRAAGRLGEPRAGCILRTQYDGPGGDRTEGDATIATLTTFLGPNIGREVVDKTGLRGSFRLTLLFNRKAALTPDAPALAGSPPIIFTAVQEQLGLKLVSARVPRQTLVVERLEKPTPN